MMFKHWNFHFALVLIFCWKTYLKVLPSLSQTVLSKIGKFLPHTNQQEKLEGGALRFNTVPQRKKGTRPAATSLAAAFVSTAGDKEKWLEASWQRPEVCCGNTSYLYVQSPRKIHEDQSHFYHMEQHTGREIPVLLRPESMPLTCCHNMIQRWCRSEAVNTWGFYARDSVPDMLWEHKTVLDQKCRPQAN